MNFGYPKAGKISIKPGESSTDLKWHQVDAVQALSARLPSTGSFAGLLVMPTGSGKTLTAVHWLLQNIIDQN